MIHLRGAVGYCYQATDPELLVEGRAGTGKSIGILTKIHALARQYAGSRFLICRQTRESITDSIAVTFEEKVLGPSHPLVSNGANRQNRHSYVYPNRSEIVYGGLDKPAKLFSTEWDIVYVNEATEISLEAWELFGRAMRNNKMPYQQRIADCNPANPSHWLNRRATPAGDHLRRAKSIEEYNALQRWHNAPQGGQMRRLISVHADNPAYWDFDTWDWTEMGQRFLASLSGMSGFRRARMLEGLWKAADGTVYGEDFSESRNVVQPFDVPAEWPHYVGLDPGYDHPCAILWFAVAPNGCIYVVDEVYEGGKGVPAHAETIHARNAGRTVVSYLGDPQHMFSSTAQSPKTIAQQFRETPYKFSFSPWPRTGTGEVAMVEAVRKKLQVGMLKVFASCQHTIDEFQSWSYKRTAQGDLPDGEDRFEDKNNHAMDVVKGVVAADPRPAGMRGVIVVGGE